MILNTGIIKEEPVIPLHLSDSVPQVVSEAISLQDHAFLTETAIGFDGLLHFYEGYDWILDTGLSDTLVEYLEWPDTLSYPYAVNANKELMDLFQR